jgi:hypothetical protein
VTLWPFKRKPHRANGGVSQHGEEAMFFDKGKSSNQGDIEQVLATSTPFKKQLRWMIQKPPAGSVKMKITPEMAEEMLTFNDRNRPISKTRVKNYAEQIKRGEWHDTGVPIIFSVEGRLLDGQHRLHGAREAGVSITVDVIFGKPDDSFYFIDVGGTRTAGDIFAINGVANSTMAAAATRFLVSYQAGKLYGDRASASGGTICQPTLEQVYQSYLSFDGLPESFSVGQSFKRDRMPCPSIAAAVHYLCAQKSRKVADEYFDRVASGVGFSSRREPAYKVRQFLIRDEAGRLTNRDVAAALIAGWNAIRTSKPLGSIDTSKIGRVI